MCPLLRFYWNLSSLQYKLKYTSLNDPRIPVHINVRTIDSYYLIVLSWINAMQPPTGDSSSVTTKTSDGPTVIRRNHSILSMLCRRLWCVLIMYTLFSVVYRIVCRRSSISIGIGRKKVWKETHSTYCLFKWQYSYLWPLCLLYDYGYLHMNVAVSVLWFRYEGLALSVQFFSMIHMGVFFAAFDDEIKLPTRFL